MYDFIVVGGGTAGCILATRLSENNDFTVLLLEAGGKPPIYSKVPILTPLLWETEVDWNYSTVPLKTAYSWLPKNQAKYPRGKMLGGTSALNFMVFLRGNKRDFDSWEKSGAKGWSWEKVLPFFLKIENSRLENVDNLIHSNYGFIPITNPGNKNPFLLTFMKAMNEMGYKKRDPNDGDQFGYDLSPLTVYDNERRTTFTNYLKPVMNCRKNLEVKTFAFVEKILFNKHKQAIGVVYSQKGCKQTVFVKKEIILSAGAVNSPQLLMLSGIGPKHHLQKLGIKVVADLPVGDNLQDHIYVPFTFSGKTEQLVNNETISQYFKNKTGPLTNFETALGFINTKYSEDNLFPDIQIIAPHWAVPTPPKNEEKYLLLPILQRPKSRGSIRLQSTNAYIHPIIDPNYLSDERDVHILSEGCKIVNNITKQMENNEFGYKQEDLFVPECEKYIKSNNNYWHCAVKHLMQIIFHVCGTCKMGDTSDTTSVVDSELKVKGIKNLRVADASIMPTIVSANLQATVMMIAEKASHLIKLEHQNVCERKSLFAYLKTSNTCSACSI